MAKIESKDSFRHLAAYKSSDTVPELTTQLPLRFNEQ
jgi:hypothetical protein